MMRELGGIIGKDPIYAHIQELAVSLDIVHRIRQYMDSGVMHQIHLLLGQFPVILVPVSPSSLFP